MVSVSLGQDITAQSTNAARRALIWILVSVGIVIVSTIGIAIVPLFFMGGGSSGGLFGPTLPATCHVNGNIVIEDETGVFEDTLVEAGPNCSVTFRNCNLQGSWVVKGSANNHITVENSVLQGTMGGIEAGPNGRVKILGNSTVTGGSTAIETGSNGQISISNSRIYSPGTAIKTSMNTRVDSSGGSIEGGTYAIDGGMNVTVILRGTKTVGARNLGMSGNIQEL